ncbi:S1 family peptidase [Hymenobacter arizonensis]|uniref:Trypsin n=1 Tax=Hymenobacter arizonensis TaxID=1227077 RepID=A0A1I6BG54_HYMAR|nr:trypsin-like serine protease [Hymenobacter arizonensis]SFQ79920.1 Trypsin [Hymenobacter arizonensis]
MKTPGSKAKRLRLNRKPIPDWNRYYRVSCFETKYPNETGLSNLETNPSARRSARDSRLGEQPFKVMGGLDIPAPDPLPDCVALGSNTRGYGASGVLISPRVVLSAAHAAAYSDFVFFGDDVHRGGKVMKVINRRIHQQFNPNTYENDLMVLLLEHPVPVLPRVIASTFLTDGASAGLVAGFGYNDVAGTAGFGKKRLGHVPIVSNGCVGVKNGIADAQQYRCFRNKEMVAIHPQGMVDACTGDSGGPFYTRDPQGNLLLSGVTSRNVGDASRPCGDGTVYVRVDRYFAWISQFLPHA